MKFNSEPLSVIAIVGVVGLIGFSSFSIGATSQTAQAAKALGHKPEACTNVCGSNPNASPCIQCCKSAMPPRGVLYTPGPMPGNSSRTVRLYLACGGTVGTQTRVDSSVFSGKRPVDQSKTAPVSPKPSAQDAVNAARGGKPNVPPAPPAVQNDLMRPYRNKGVPGERGNSAAGFGELLMNALLGK